MIRGRTGRLVLAVLLVGFPALAEQPWAPSCGRFLAGAVDSEAVVDAYRRLLDGPGRGVLDSQAFAHLGENPFFFDAKDGVEGLALSQGLAVLGAWVGSQPSGDLLTERLREVARQRMSEFETGLDRSTQATRAALRMEPAHRTVTLEGPTRISRDLTVSPDGKFIAGMAQTSLFLWDAISGAQVGYTSGSSRDPEEPFFDPRGNLYLMAANNPVRRLTPPPSGPADACREAKWRWNYWGYLSPHFLRGGKSAVFTQREEVRWVDLPSGKVRRKERIEGPTRLLLVSPNGKRIVTWHTGFGMALHFTDNWARVVSRTGHSARTGYVVGAWSPDGKSLLLGAGLGRDGEDEFHVLEGGTLKTVFRWPISVSRKPPVFSRDGRFAAVVDERRGVHVLNILTGHSMQVWGDGMTHVIWDIGAVDGKLWVVAERLRVFDMALGSLMFQSPPFEDRVPTSAVADASGRLYVLENRETLHVWDLNFD